MDTHALLTQAIATKTPVIGRYGGRRRTFCPHALGRKRGAHHVLVYQYGGASQSGLPEEGEWRCLRLDGLTDVALHADQWHTAENVFNPQSCLDEVDVVVRALPPRDAGEP